MSKNSGPFKWQVLLNSEPNREYFEKLKNYLNSIGLKSELEIIGPESAPPVEIERFIRYDEGRGDVRLTPLLQANQEVLRMGHHDGIARNGSQLWPQCFLFDSILYAVSKAKVQLNRQGSVLVFGSDSFTRASLFGAARLGLKRYVVVDDDDDKCEKFVNEIAPLFWSGPIEALPFSQLMQLPGVFSLIINGFSEEQTLTYYDKLAYFNYLSPAAVVVDLKKMEMPAYTDEATRVGAQVLNGNDINIALDLLWWEFLTQRKLDYQAFRLALKT